MFAIPRAILESLDLAADRSVGLSVSHGRLIIDPHPRPRYTLAELVEECDPTAPLTDEEQQWRNSPPIGREEI
jgi:antitoxin ChpS